MGRVENRLGFFPCFRAGDDGDAVKRGVDGMPDALVGRINLPLANGEGKRRDLGLATWFLDIDLDRDGG